MNFGKLKSTVLNQLFPEGIQENLLDSVVGGVTKPGIFTGFLHEALYDLQKYVSCYQFGNTDVYNHCATYFQCGMTVLPAPRGHISSVYVIDQVAGASNATTAALPKTIAPAAEIQVSGPTIGQVISRTYQINPASGTPIYIMGASRGVGTAYSLTAEITITPTDGSAEPVSKTYTVTDSFLSFDPEALIGSASANAYVVQIVLTLTGLSGNQSQWVHNNHFAEIELSWSQTGAAPPTERDWCSKVYYQQVEYCHLQSLARLCERCGNGANVGVVDAFLASIFGPFRMKRRYPAPTDAGFESLPKLPNGFHYPQTSTDASGRAPSGFWAIHRGRIYVSPWIQSTESVVIEWDGIKRQFADADIVEDDPKFVQAVRLHVGMQHAFSFDNNPNRHAQFKDQFYGSIPLGIPGALPELIHECHEENRLRRCGESGTGKSAARGMLQASDANLFSNDRQEYRASCPANMDGDSVTAVVEAGEVSSALSVADANARALSLAQQRANDKLVCTEKVITYWNTPQTYTAYCAGASGNTPAADGTPSTVAIGANEFSSTVSQAAADAAALAAATAQANAGLTCTYWNAPQTYTAECPNGTTGSDVEKSVSGHTYSSTISQADADAQALAAVKAEAESELVCDAVQQPVFFNSQIQREASVHVSGCAHSLNPGIVRVICVVPAGRFSSIISQSDANAQATNVAIAGAGARAAQLAAVRLCGNYQIAFGS